MRFPLLLASAVLLFASPAHAAEDFSKAPVFGTKYCTPTFACKDLQNPQKMDEYEKRAYDVATTCVKQRYYRLSSKTEFFDKRYGLGADLCLKSLPTEKDDSGYAMTTRCCVEVAKADTCQVVCKVYARR